MASSYGAWMAIGFMLIIGAAGSFADEQQEKVAPEGHVITIPRFTRAPEIDGRMGESEWSAAAATTGFTRNDKMIASRAQPVVWAGYDEKAIYVAFVSPIPNGVELVANVQGVGGPVSSDDDVEVLLQPLRAGTPVFHVLGGPAGGYAVFADGMPTERPVTYRTTRTAEQWIAELAIPFESIGVAAPGDGEVWGVNFCRGHANPREWTSWAPAVVFNDSSTFGRLRFGGDGAAARITSIGNVLIGKLDIQGSALAKRGQLQLIAGAGPREALQVKPDDPAMMHESAKPQAELLGAETRPILPASEIGPIAYAKTLPAVPCRVIWEIADAADGTVVQKHWLDVDPLPPFVMELQPSPRRGTVEVQLNAEKAWRPSASIQGSVSFRCANAERAPITANATFEREIGKATVQLSDLPEGEYTVEASVTVDGERSTASARFLRAGQVPEAYSKLGLEPEVPPPWTPVTVEGNQVGVWNRSIRFGGNGLPEAIETAGRSMLAGPIALKAFAGGAELPATIGAAQVKKLSEGAAEATGAVTFPGLTIRTRSLTEFDGCIRVELDLTPATSGSPERVTLELPIANEFAQLIHSHGMSWGGTDSGAVPEGTGIVWSNRFTPVIWVGSTRAGICWFAASQKGWTLGPSDAPSQELVRSADGVVLRVHLASKAFPNANPRRIVLGLQPTPVKPLRSDWRLKERYGRHPLAPPELLMNSVFFEGTGKWWGWPEPKSDDEVSRMEADLAAGRIPKQPGREPITWAKIKESRDQVHADGGRVYWYANTQMLGMTSPWYHTYGRDWNLTYGLGYENPADEFWNAKGVCPASGWQDLYIGTIATRSLPLYDFDGIYIDLFLPWHCANDVHGCGYYDDEGKHQPEYTIWPMREQMKRLYRVVHGRKDGSIIGHISAAFVPATHGFVDSALNGEQHWTYFHAQGGVDYHEILPLDKCRAEVLGRQWGWASIFLPEFKNIAGKTSRELLSLVLLHDSLIVPAYMDIAETNEANAILFKLGFVDAEFIGYFDDPPPAKAEDPEVFISAYRRAGGDPRRAILIITNHTAMAGSFAIAPDARALGLPAGGWVITEHPDSRTTRAIEPSGKSFTVQIPARDFRIISIEAK